MIYDDDYEYIESRLDEMHQEYIYQRNLRAKIASNVLSGLISTINFNKGWEPDELVQMSVDLTDNLLKRLND